MTDKYAVKMSLLSLKGDRQLALEYESLYHSPKIFLLATSLRYEKMKLQSFINIELISLLRLALPSPLPCPSSLPLSFLPSYKYMSGKLLGSGDTSLNTTEKFPTLVSWCLNSSVHACEHVCVCCVCVQEESNTKAVKYMCVYVYIIVQSFCHSDADPVTSCVCEVASVMADSLRPYGLQPTSLLCP